jgi:hypothetical protein
MEFFRLIRSPAWLRHDKNGITQRILRATDGQANPETGSDKLSEIATNEDCQLGRKTDYGQRYLIEFELSHGRKTARVRSIWIIRTGENFPRLVTCYVV